MTTVKNVPITLPAHCAGSKFRPVHWSDISGPKARIVGWGIEEKPAGRRRYELRALDGQIHPFKTEAEAKAACVSLNEQAQAAVNGSPA